MDRQHAELLQTAIAYDRDDPRRIQHLVKIHGFAAAARKAIFRTETGKRLLDEMFAPERKRVLP